MFCCLLLERLLVYTLGQLDAKEGLLHMTPDLCRCMGLSKLRWSMWSALPHGLLLDSVWCFTHVNALVPVHQSSSELHYACSLQLLCQHVQETF